MLAFASAGVHAEQLSDSSQLHPRSSIGASTTPDHIAGINRPTKAAQPGKTFQDCAGCPVMVVLPAAAGIAGFAIGKYTVTFDEWDACAAAGRCNGYRPADQGWGRGRRPVIFVSWQDASAYAVWLSEKTGKSYRLPSEAEWEFAARAGTATEYYWGNEIGSNNANCAGCGSRWDGEQTAPAGNFAANGYGLHDMLGNVWQWTNSCWDGNCAKRVIRGGSWKLVPQYLSAVNRGRRIAWSRDYDLGFRLVRAWP
ncbi:MAG: SUMF1/EgtB/PvdO family nonheme iron enzyme [Pseudomonadota bacterium]